MRHKQASFETSCDFEGTQKKKKRMSERKGKGLAPRRARDNVWFLPVSVNTQEAFVLNTLGSVSKCGSKREKKSVGIWADTKLPSNSKHKQTARRNIE